MAEPDRQPPDRNNGPPARATERRVRASGAPFGPGAPRRASRVLARAGTIAASGSWWREPLVLLLLAASGLGATILLSAAAAVPAEFLMPLTH